MSPEPVLPCNEFLMMLFNESLASKGSNDESIDCISFPKTSLPINDGVLEYSTIPFLSSSPTVLLNCGISWCCKTFPKVIDLMDATTTPVNTPGDPFPVILITGYDIYNLGILSFDSIKLL